MNTIKEKIVITNNDESERFNITLMEEKKKLKDYDIIEGYLFKIYIYLKDIINQEISNEEIKYWNKNKHFEVNKENFKEVYNNIKIYLDTLNKLIEKENYKLKHKGPKNSDHFLKLYKTDNNKLHLENNLLKQKLDYFKEQYDKILMEDSETNKFLKKELKSIKHENKKLKANNLIKHDNNNYLNTNSLLRSSKVLNFYEKNYIINLQNDIKNYKEKLVSQRDVIMKYKNIKNQYEIKLKEKEKEIKRINDEILLFRTEQKIKNEKNKKMREEKWLKEANTDKNESNLIYYKEKLKEKNDKIDKLNFRIKKSIANEKKHLFEKKIIQNERQQNYLLLLKFNKNLNNMNDLT